MGIDKNNMVTLTYDLHVDNNKGELIEQASTENPLQFLFGAGMMLPKFEEGLASLNSGEAFEISIKNADAYGAVNKEAIVDLPKNVFLVEGKFDSELIKVGNAVPMMSSNGQRMNGLVMEITEETVKMDFNHPLAGEDLYFKGNIVEVREASEEEIAQIINGNGGCGCGSGDSCDSGGCDDGGCGTDSSEGGCGCGC